MWKIFLDILTQKRRIFLRLRPKGLFLTRRKVKNSFLPINQSENPLKFWLYSNTFRDLSFLAKMCRQKKSFMSYDTPVNEVLHSEPKLFSIIIVFTNILIILVKMFTFNLFIVHFTAGKCECTRTNCVKCLTKAHTQLRMGKGSLARFLRLSNS